MHQDDHNQPEPPESDIVSVKATPVDEPTGTPEPTPPVMAEVAASDAAQPDSVPLPEAPPVAILETAPIEQTEAPVSEPSTLSYDVAEGPATAPVGSEAPAYESPSWSASDEVPTSSSATESPAWVTVPLTDSPSPEGYSESKPAETPGGYEGPADPHIEMPQGGPNWMLAFVCAWAAFTSFMEAPVAYAAKETMVNGSSVTLTAGDRMYGGAGFALLGLGLLLFGIEALMWGRRRRGVSALLSIGIPVLVSLAGIIALVLSHYPGSRI